MLDTPVRPLETRGEDSDDQTKPPDPDVLADLQKLIDRGPKKEKTKLEQTLDPYEPLLIAAHENGISFKDIHANLTKRGTIKVNVENVRRYIVMKTKPNDAPAPRAPRKPKTAKPDK